MAILINGADDGRTTAFDALADNGTWRKVQGAGSAAITSGIGVLTQPATPGTLGDSGRSALVRSPNATVPSPLTTLCDVTEFEALVRLVELTNGAADTHFGLYLTSSHYAGLSQNEELRLWVTAGGTITCGYAGAAWSGDLASDASVVAFNGTWWLRMVLRGYECQLLYGQGTATTPPASAYWKELYRGNLASRLRAGGPRWDELGMYLSAYSNPGASVTARFSHLRVIDRSIRA